MTGRASPVKDLEAALRHMADFQLCKESEGKTVKDEDWFDKESIASDVREALKAAILYIEEFRSYRLDDCERQEIAAAHYAIQAAHDIIVDYMDSIHGPKREEIE